jgi:hypothetical protein
MTFSSFSMKHFLTTLNFFLIIFFSFSSLILPVTVQANNDYYGRVETPLETGISGLVINRVYFLGGAAGNPDWVELYYDSTEPLSLEGFKLEDVVCTGATCPNEVNLTGTIGGPNLEDKYRIFTWANRLDNNAPMESINLITPENQLVETFIYGTDNALVDGVLVGNTETVGAVSRDTVIPQEEIPEEEILPNVLNIIALDQDGNPIPNLNFSLSEDELSIENGSGQTDLQGLLTLQDFQNGNLLLDAFYSEEWETVQILVGEDVVCNLEDTEFPDESCNNILLDFNTNDQFSVTFIFKSRVIVEEENPVVDEGDVGVGDDNDTEEETQNPEEEVENEDENIETPQNPEEIENVENNSETVAFFIELQDPVSCLEPLTARINSSDKIVSANLKINNFEQKFTNLSLTTEFNISQSFNGLENIQNGENQVEISVVLAGGSVYKETYYQDFNFTKCPINTLNAFNSNKNSINNKLSTVRTGGFDY